MTGRTSAVVLGPRADVVRRRFEVPILIAARLVIPVIFIEERATSIVALAVARKEIVAACVEATAKQGRFSQSRDYMKAKPLAEVIALHTETSEPRA